MTDEKQAAAKADSRELAQIDEKLAALRAEAEQHERDLPGLKQRVDDLEIERAATDAEREGVARWRGSTHSDEAYEAFDEALKRAQDALTAYNTANSEYSHANVRLRLIPNAIAALERDRELLLAREVRQTSWLDRARAAFTSPA